MTKPLPASQPGTAPQICSRLCHRAPGLLHAAVILLTLLAAAPAGAALYGTGRNNYGQLGNGTMTDRTVVFTAADTSGVLAGKTIMEVAAGGFHTVALDSAGQVYAWGGNTSGQLGDGTTTVRTTPVAVDMSGVLAGKTIVAVAAGGAHTVALDSAGQVYAWGNNTNGQLGDGTTTLRTTPVAVDAGGVLAGKTIVAVAAGWVYTVALDSAGQVYAWGYNYSGQLGDGTYDQRTTPVAVNVSGVLAGKTIMAVAAGGQHALALDSAGRVYAWGANSSGQLGDGSMNDRLTPVAVNVTGVLAGKTIVAVAAGSLHTVALDSAGKVYAWGSNSNGQIGDGTTLTRRTMPIAVDVSGELAGKTIVAVAAGGIHNMVLDSDGRVYAWGDNFFGQLGIGVFTGPNRAPVAVVLGASTTAVVAGSDTSYVLTGPGQSAYAAWATANGVSTDPAAEGGANLQAFAFGYPPGGTTGALVYTGTFAGSGTIPATGQPITRMEGADTRAVFVRRKDYVTAGLTYTVRFSATLGLWEDGFPFPTVLADDGVNQIVSVPYPALVSGLPPHFFRIRVTITP